MEVTPATLSLNTLGEHSDFEAEVESVTDAINDEPCRDDHKVNRLVERRRLVKEVAQAQSFGRHRQKKCFLGRGSSGKLDVNKYRQCDAPEQQNQPSGYNFGFFQRRSWGTSTDGQPFTLKGPIVTVQMNPAAVGLAERVRRWHVEVQQTAVYVAAVSPFAASARLFHYEHKLKSYRVLYQGKYYHFEFEGEEMKEYCELEYDRT
ncbi:hypothetical protein [Aeromonas sp. DNP9]|uniref:hypothetical protein n=1 Tax=Aeromonas sp. DNP9 TaxID=1535548 RepID=UPI001112E059|nr:hypothetical protein [Aeromonas sp. DNP9]